MSLCRLLFLNFILLGSVYAHTQIIPMEAAKQILQDENRNKVLFYFIEDCPACRGIAHKLVDMAETYPAAELGFLGVYVAEEEDQSALRTFMEKFQLNFPVVQDSQLHLVKRYNAQVTPEVVLLDPQGKISYQGAIDNYYYRLGKHRKITTKFYLRNAIEQLLAGKPVKVPYQKPVGCYIKQ